MRTLTHSLSTLPVNATGGHAADYKPSREAVRASASVKILGITIFQEDGDTAALMLGCCLQHGGLVFGRDRSEQTILCLSLTSIHLGWPDDVCVHCRHTHAHSHTRIHIHTLAGQKVIVWVKCWWMLEPPHQQWEMLLINQRTLWLLRDVRPMPSFKLISYNIVLVFSEYRIENGNNLTLSCYFVLYCLFSAAVSPILPPFSTVTFFLRVA